MTAKLKHGYYGGEPTRGADEGSTQEQLLKDHRRPGRAEGASIHRAGPSDADGGNAEAGMPDVGSMPTPPKGEGPHIDHDIEAKEPTTGEGPDTDEENPS